MNTTLQQTIIKFSQYAKQNRPIIAAHRGLSSLYPENSIPGFLAAFEYSDYIELDVVLSKENDVIVCHDTFLSKVSDVAQKQEFQHRKIKRTLYNEQKEDWWISDFTLQELKSLRIRQCILQRKSEFDWMYTIPTLKETLKAVEQYNKENNTNKGVLIEIKDDIYHKEYVKTEIAQHVQQVLKSLEMDTIENTINRIPIMIMAFDSTILRYFQQQSNLPRVYLLWADDKNLPQIEQVVQIGDVIGLDLRLIWDKNRKSLGSWIEQAQQAKLPIFGWTFQNDCKEMQDLFETTDIQSIYKKCNFLDGIITEFPQKMN